MIMEAESHSQLSASWRTRECGAVIESESEELPTRSSDVPRQKRE